MKNVRKSKIELIGPKDIINFLTNEISHLFGLSMYSLSTLSVGIVISDKS